MRTVHSEPVSAEQIDEYLRHLEKPRRSTLEAMRRTILEQLPEAEQPLSPGRFRRRS